MITRKMLGRPIDLLNDSLPEWAFELEAGKWRKYAVEDSMVLERYWKVFDAATQAGASGDQAPHLAKLRLMRKDALVDVSSVTCQVGDGRPRPLKRELNEAGWLTNAYFFRAFKAALERSGVDVSSAPEDMFDFRYNQDFRNVKDDGRELIRGGMPYQLPTGWMRFAVNVNGQFSDNLWLREDETGWAVAYHGTSGSSLPGILNSGFRLGSGQKFTKDCGQGVYCSPLVDVAQHYSKPQLIDGHYVQIVLQIRVKPSAIRPVQDPKATEFERKYWVINDSECLRPYGVLIREISLQDYIPAEAMVYGFDHPHVKKLMQDIRDGK